MLFFGFNFDFTIIFSWTYKPPIFRYQITVDVPVFDVPLFDVIGSYHQVQYKFGKIDSWFNKKAA